MDIVDIISKNMGVKTSYSISPLISQATTTIQKVARSNPRRLGLSVVNLGAYTAYLLPHPSVSSSNSYVLAAGGQGMVFSVMEDFILPSLDWYIVATGTSAIMTIEILIAS